MIDYNIDLTQIENISLSDEYIKIINDSYMNDYNLCDYGINPSHILKLHQQGITILDSKKTSFSNLVSAESKYIYDKLVQILDKLETDSILPFNHLSAYCLYEFDIKKNVISKISSAGFYEIDELIFKDEIDLIRLCNLKTQTAFEVHNALKKVLRAVNKKLFDIIETILKNLNQYKQIQKKELLSQCSDDIYLVSLALQLLYKAKKIMINEDSIVLFQMTLDEAMRTFLTEREEKVLRYRFQGLTFEQIADEYKVTRERIRQIQTKAISHLKLFPAILEDKYATYFSTYIFSKDEFCEAFDENLQTYLYLSLRYTKGKIQPSIDDLKDIDLISREYLTKLEHKYHVIIHGEKIENNPESIISFVVNTSMPEYFSMNHLIHFLNQLVIENPFLNLKNNISENYLKNYYYKYDIINAFQKGFKYFPVTKNLIEDLILELNLTKYHNVIISTRKLFFENKDYLEEKNIKDEYELHNVLKIGLHFKNHRPDIDASFLRMPKIKFGNADEYELVKNCVLAYSPVEADDFYDFMELEYGYRKNSFISYFSTHFSEYLQNGMIDVAAKKPPESEYIELQLLLTEEFYFIEDFENILKEGEFSLDWLTKNNIKYLGYTKFSTYMIKSTYPNAIDFFKSKLISINNIFDSSKIDKRFKYLSSFTSYLYDLIIDYDYLQIDKTMYINQNRIQEVLGMSKNDLIEYAESIEDMVGNEYFTIDNLISIYGFEDVFREYGLNDYIYTSLFKRNQKIQSLLFQNHWIFKKTKKKITQVSFIEEVVDISNEKNIYEIMDFIEDKYGLRCNLSDIKQLLKESSLYYNDDLEKVYVDYDQYLEEFK
ncbi:sigma factor-like helix-turn-helix DNA-binding protein [Faecalicoccus acidiformans]|uniref:sigma factor-like helix-turn-helix DNA-binding protein n=1 Tax=Faecalicoccus acidiformans TaxID=915173 RepID=UPI003B5C959F